MSDAYAVNINISQIVDFLPDPTFAIDRQGRVVLWNKAMERLTGIPAGKMLGKGNHEYALPIYGCRRPVMADVILNPDLKRDIESPYQYREDGSLDFDGEVFFHLTQRRCYITAHASPFHDSSGNLLGAIQTLRDITARKQVEQSLVESEEKFHLLFESSEDGNLIMEDGRYIDCNASALRIAGVSDKSQLLGKRPMDFAMERQPDGLDSEEKSQKMIAMAHKKGSHHFEWVRRRPDGSEMLIDVMLSTIPMQGKKLLLTTWRDLSERKHAEEALRASEERYRMLFEHATEGIFQSTSEGRFINVNPSLARMGGFSSTQEMIASVRDLAHDLYANPDDRHAVVSMLAERDTVEGFEVAFLRKDRRQIWISMNIHAVRDERGCLRYFEGTCINITERKQAEERLKESEHRLAQFIDFLPDPTLAVDMDGRVLIWNRAMEDMSGIKASEIIGQTNYAYALPFYGRPTPILVDLCLHPDAEAEKQYAFIRKEENLLIAEAQVMNKEKFIWGKASRIFNSRGDLIGAIETMRDVTERKQAEQALRESEEQFRYHFENASEGIFRTTTAGRYIRVNTSLSRMFGFSSPQDMIDSVKDIGREIYADPEDRHTLRRMLEEHDKVEGYEVAILRKDKSRIWISMNVHTVKDGQGCTRYYDGSCVDVTERKRAEDALRASEERYRTLFENATEGIFQSTLTGRFINVNPSLARMGAFSSPQEMVASVTDIAQELYANPEQRHAMVRMLAEHDLIEGFEAEMLRRDGSRMFISMNMHTVRDAQGNILYFDGTCVDITERKKAEARLRASEERYRLVADNIHDMISLYDMDLNYTYVSPSVERITGHTWQEMLGRSALAIIDDEESHEKLQGIHTQIRELVRNQDPFLQSRSWTVELKRITKSGKPMWTESNISILLDDGGVPLGILSVTRDIDERKRAEEQMQFYQEQLQRSQKLEAIGTLAGGIAHDFNNILSVIIGFSELVRDDPATAEKARDMISEVLKAGVRAKDLVHQILTFSRQVEVTVQPLDIRLIVKEALKLLRATIPSTIAIVQDIDPNAGSILADPTQIHQVVMNLCTNAYHAMQSEGGTLNVGLEAVNLEAGTAYKHPDLQPGDYVKLSVQDTGCGMDEATVRRIFEPFFTTKEKGSGTGLGLAITHGIVKKLRGGIVVSSTPGAGSTFEVFIPRFGIDASEDMGTAETIPAGNGERILLVDDEPDIVRFTTLMLEQLGYAVSGHTASQPALEALRRDPRAFDLVLTDQTMPDLRGDQLAAAILQIRPEIPVVLMTGYSVVIDREAALRLGVKGFIDKPFSSSTMARSISKALLNNGDI